MTIKEMECVYSAIWHAKELINHLCCEDYPYSDFEDEDFCEMYYELNRMNMDITEKINAAREASAMGGAEQ